jgi:hypothetical protein
MRLSPTGARLYGALLDAHGLPALLDAYGHDEDATPADILRSAMAWGDIDPETLELT